ncbi:hypothetical protein [Stenotrophomonas acidaminiphila]|jgi:predicted transcriptional regulator|uniref:hypothetical protein n=1 Tax=Stenotrophomonas acidaminiphila TaxID=128780 RepID=UPI0028ACC69C|nr:hypothetical protein [Stenotrophomonas acidaminiphila]
MTPEDRLLQLLPDLSEEEKDRRTRQGLADVDAGRTILEEDFEWWIKTLGHNEN